MKPASLVHSIEPLPVILSQLSYLTLSLCGSIAALLVPLRLGMVDELQGMAVDWGLLGAMGRTKLVGGASEAAVAHGGTLISRLPVYLTPPCLFLAACIDLYFSSCVFWCVLHCQAV